jgi:hypothetical protein
MIRFVICVDVDKEDVTEAYKELHHGMTMSDLEWESTDEWYTPDGGQGLEEAIEAARMSLHPQSDGPPYDAATATGMYDREDG